MSSFVFLLFILALSTGYAFISPALQALRSRPYRNPYIVPDSFSLRPLHGRSVCLYGTSVPDMNWDPKAAPKLDFNEDYYSVLEADPAASDRDLKKQYYKIVFKYHPDRKEKEEEKALSNKQMMVINNAYAILKENDSRTAYDRKRKFGVYGKGNTSRPSSSNTPNTGGARSNSAAASKNSDQKSSYSGRQTTGGSRDYSRAATKDSYRSAYEYSKSAEQINERFRRQFYEEEEFKKTGENVGDILEDMWKGINENPEQVMEDFMDFIGAGSGSFMEGSEDVMQGKYGAFWEEDDLGPRNSPRDTWKQQQSRTNTASSNRQVNSDENEEVKKRRMQEDINKKIQKKKELTQEKQSLQSSLIKMAALVDELKEERIIEEKDLMRTKPKQGAPRDKVELELRLKRMEYVQVLSKRQREAEARMANIKRQIRNVTELLSYIDL